MCRVLQVPGTRDTVREHCEAARRRREENAVEERMDVGEVFKVFVPGLCRG